MRIGYLLVTGPVVCSIPGSVERINGALGATNMGPMGYYRPRAVACAQRRIAARDPGRRPV
jgi:hypothetical protein